MFSTIFIVGADNALTELQQGPYESEDLLQRLIGDHPAVLSSATGADGGLLLVEREFPVADKLSGAGRWSLDHLFLDREGVPVLVEVKRASDTRIRREVVAQMLDYAANGVAYWPLEQISEGFRKGALKEGHEPDQRLAQFLGEGEPDAFWKSVEANLRSGRLRLVFLADQIAPELRRIVEFLNEQMRPAEVLAVEVVQYVNTTTGVRTLVPSLVGATERAKAVKSVATALHPMDEGDWLASIEVEKGKSVREAVERALGWMRAHGLTTTMSDTQDSIYGSARLPNGLMVYPFYVRRSGRLDLSLQNVRNAPEFATDEARLALVERMRNEIPEARTTSNSPNGWPSIGPDLLTQEAIWNRLTIFMASVLASMEP